VREIRSYSRRGPCFTSCCMRRSALLAELLPLVVQYQASLRQACTVQRGPVTSSLLPYLHAIGQVCRPQDRSKPILGLHIPPSRQFDSCQTCHTPQHFHPLPHFSPQPANLICLFLLCATPPILHHRRLHVSLLISVSGWYYLLTPASCVEAIQ
jgi:hypothetical protein